MIWKVLAYAVSATNTTSYCCIILTKTWLSNRCSLIERIFMSQISINFNINNFVLMSPEDHNLYICPLFFVNPVLKNIDMSFLLIKKSFLVVLSYVLGSKFEMLCLWNVKPKIRWFLELRYYSALFLFFFCIDAYIVDTCFQWHMVAPAPMDMQVYSFLGARDFVNMVVMLEFEYLLVIDIDVCGSICLWHM